jgi:hypothetical protein
LNRLTRDVAINVATNIIAAAIIYLAGASAGLLPYSSELALVAAIILALAVILGSVWAEDGESPKSRALWQLIIMYVVALATPGFLIELTRQLHDTPTSNGTKYMLVAIVVPMFAATIFQIRDYRKDYLRMCLRRVGVSA